MEAYKQKQVSVGPEKEYSSQKKVSSIVEVLVALRM